MRFGFQHGIGFERVVAVEGSVEVEDLQWFPRHYAAQYGLGDGVFQADQQFAPYAENFKVSATHPAASQRK